MLYLRHFYIRFLKDFQYSVINLTGLITGITVFLVVFVILTGELSYDQFHEKKDRIYRVGTLDISGDMTMDMAITSHELAPLLKAEFPEIENFGRFLKLGEVDVGIKSSSREEIFREEQFFRADPEVFDLFDYHFILGNRQTCLRGKNSVVITEKIAKKYFGSVQKALDQLITVVEDDGEISLIVTAIIEDLPVATHLKFDALISGIPDRGFTNEDGTTNNSRLFAIDYLYTYLLMQEGAVIEFEKHWETFTSKYYGSESENSGSVMTHTLTDLESIHYNAKQFDLPAGDPKYLTSLLFLGALILLITLINFVNLTSARSHVKFKEVALRKIFGASKTNLIIQMMGDSVLLIMIAYVFGLIGAYLLINSGFFSWLNYRVDIDPLFDMAFHMKSVLAILILAILSATYPAVKLIRFAGISDIREEKGKKFSVGSILVVTQFAFSIAIVLLTLLFYRQIQFVKNRDIGFNHQNTLLISKTGRFNSKAEVLVNLLKSRLPALEGIGLSNFIHGENTNQDGFRKTTDDENSWVSIPHVRVTHGYFEALKMQVTFKDEKVPVTNENTRFVVINEEVVGLLNLENPFNESLKFIVGNQNVKIIGIVKNYNFKSLHHEIEPLILSIEDPRHLDHMFIRSRIPLNHDFVRQVRAIYGQIFFDTPLNERSYSTVVNLQYDKDVGKMNLFMVLSVISIIMAMIGFVGLTSYNIQKMTRQIMIRKVLGATYADRLSILLKDKVIMALVAMIIAVPLANYCFYNWINTYFYKIEFSIIWTLTVSLSFIFVILIIGIAISRKTINGNPSELLRVE